MTIRPTEVRIGQTIWAVKWDSELLSLLDEVDGEPKLGLCLTDQNQILLRENLVPAMERDGLLHELLHAITHTYSMKWKANEERMIQKLSPLLLDTLRGNPVVLAFLTEG
jgi:hypothetical protein